MSLAFYIHIVHIYHSGYGQSDCRILYMVEEQSESFLMLNGIMAFYSLSRSATHSGMRSLGLAIVKTHILFP